MYSLGIHTLGELAKLVGGEVYRSDDAGKTWQKTNGDRPVGGSGQFLVQGAGHVPVLPAQGVFGNDARSHLVADDDHRLPPVGQSRSEGHPFDVVDRDPEVVDFLSREPAVQRMIADISGFLSTWIAKYQDFQRSYLTVAIGCTGGQHRSVYIVETLANRLAERYGPIRTRHHQLPGGQ